MLRFSGLFLAVASALAAQPIRDLALDPTQAVDLPVSREITTVMFPGAITAVAGADMLIDGGRAGVEGGCKQGCNRCDYLCALLP